MPAKAKKVTITMKSISDTAGGAPDVMELITEGTLRPVTLGKVQGWEISYNDSEATGFAGSVTTVSCIGEELASMTRNGAANARLIIEKTAATTAITALNTARCCWAYPLQE